VEFLIVDKGKLISPSDFATPELQNVTETLLDTAYAIQLTARIVDMPCCEMNTNDFIDVSIYLCGYCTVKLPSTTQYPFFARTGSESRGPITEFETLYMQRRPIGKKRYERIVFGRKGGSSSGSIVRSFA
jgi:hypothetical protein